MILIPTVPLLDKYNLMILITTVIMTIVAVYSIIINYYYYNSYSTLDVHVVYVWCMCYSYSTPVRVFVRSLSQGDTI